MQFRILGPLEVGEGGRAVSLGGGKQRSLLALLLLHANEVIATEQLVHELWGERPPATAAKSVQVYVSTLRKVLGPANGSTGVLRTRGSGYVLCIAPEDLDVHRFERRIARGRQALSAGEPEAAARELREALALWRGAALADFAYEPFAQGEIARLEDMRLSALEDRVEADLQLGRHVDLVGELEALAAEHPLRERLAGQLMVALYRSGRQAEALEAYKRTRDYLATELGLEPGPALRDLQAAVLAQDPELAPPARREAASESARPDAAPALVGRERELAELEAAMLAAWDGGGALQLLAGEAGIGKSRLAEALAERARARGGQVVWARVWDSGGAPAFYPWTQVVRGLADVLPAGDLQALAPVAPELGGGREELPAADVSGPARFALFEALTALLRTAAERSPLLVVIDDVHAADPGSLLALRFAARQHIGAPAFLLATERDPADDVGPEAARRLAELARACGRTTLGGLDEAATAELIEHRGFGAPARLAHAVHATTDGNPFFSEEMIQLLVADGRLGDESEAPHHLPLPASVKEALGSRLDLLPEPTRDALRAASIVGRDFRLTTVQEVLGRDGNALLEALDEAVGARLLVEAGPGRFRFSHALVREELYSELGSVQRIQGHRAVGEALERRHGASPEHAAELAHHFALAAPGGEVAERAIGHAMRAGDHAGRALAYEQAAAMFELALELGELTERDDTERRAELLLSLGAARTCAGDERARETLLAAADAARTAGRADLLARDALAFRAWQLSPGIVDDALVELMEEALAALEQSGGSALRARLLARLAVALYYRPASAERREALADEAVALARAEGDRDLLAYVLGNAQLATWGPDTTDRSLEWSDEMLELTETGPDVELALGVRNRRIDLLLELGDLPGADIAIEALDRLSRQHPHLRGEAWVCLQRGRRALIEGDLEAAERLTPRGAALAQRLHDPTIAMLATAQDIGLRWALGRMDEMEATIRGFADGAPGMPVWRAALARVYCAQGRDAEAQRELDRLAGDDFAALPRDNVWLVGMAMLAEVCTHLDDRDHAESLERLLRPFAGRVVTSPHAIFGGPVARFLGLLAVCRGDVDAAAADVERARAIARRMNAPFVLETLERDEERLGVARTARVNVPKPAHGVVRREGDVWLLRYEDRTVRVRDGKGIRYLAALLASAGDEIHALDLVRLEAGTTGSAVIAGDAGPLLDPEAKAAYRRRVAELREELEEAERFNDPERAAGVRDEMEAIASELSGAVGLGGRDRRAASEAERARVNVTRAIRSTLKRIGEYDERLGVELATTVRTGNFCAHEPDARHPVHWEVEQS